MRLEIKKMATSMFLTLILDISRTSWHMKVSDGSFFWKCNALSFEPNLCGTQNSPLTFEDFKTCLFSDSTEYRSQLMFRSSKHEVHTIEVNKVALNRDDDKRISRKDGISTLARGHKDLSWCPLLGELSLI